MIHEACKAFGNSTQVFVTKYVSRELLGIQWQFNYKYTLKDFKNAKNEKYYFLNPEHF